MVVLPPDGSCGSHRPDAGDATRVTGRSTRSLMMEDEENDIRAQLVHLRQEHRDLDFAIAALVDSGRGDHLTIQRLKKKKLAIKDKIIMFEDRLVPDIIA